MRLRTLREPVEIRGIGLHTGHHATLKLLPSERPGWWVRRVDLPGAPEFAAEVGNVHETAWSTTLGGTEGLLHCSEHLLAALSGLEVTAATLEIDNEEVPILDGSAQPFVEALQRVGTRELDAVAPRWRVRRECCVQDGEKSVTAVPDDTLRVTSAVDYSHPLAPAQLFSIAVTPDSFAREIAPARTFALSEWVEPLQAQGLIQGGSLDCAFIIFPDRYSSPLRFPDEMARHKALDLLGDLALLGGPIVGHFTATKASHALHVELVRKLKSGDYLTLEA